MVSQLLLTFLKIPLGHSIFKYKQYLASDGALMKERGGWKRGIGCQTSQPPLDFSAQLAHLGHAGLDAGGVVGPGAGRAVDESGFGVLVTAHQTMVRPCRLVDALIAVPENKIGQTFHHVWDRLPRAALKRLANTQRWLTSLLPE